MGAYALLLLSILPFIARQFVSAASSTCDVVDCLRDGGYCVALASEEGGYSCVYTHSAQLKSKRNVKISSSKHCDNVNCVHGSCIELEDGYLCVCDPPFTGEHCAYTSNIKREVSSRCNADPCKNGGTCVDLMEPLVQGEAPIGEGEAEIDEREALGEANIDGEAALTDMVEAPAEAMGESESGAEELESDCTGEGDCLFTCICAPEFTGRLCSDQIGAMCSVRNCTRCDTSPSICDECDSGLRLSGNECKCPVAGCQVCDTSVTSCDLCTEDGAEFDLQSLQCAIKSRQNSGVSSDTEIDPYLASNIVIMVVLPTLALLCCSCCIIAIAIRRTSRKKSDVYLDNEAFSTVNSRKVTTSFQECESATSDD